MKLYVAIIVSMYHFALYEEELINKSIVIITVYKACFEHDVY